VPNKDLEAAIAISGVQFKPEVDAADLANLLAPEVEGLSPSILPAVVKANLESRRFAHFRADAGPPVGSVEHYAQNYRQGHGLAPIPAHIVRFDDGMRSHAPASHADLQGGAPTIPQPNEAQTIARQSRGLGTSNRDASRSFEGHSTALLRTPALLV
jgi:hypothetical protein